MQSLTLRFDRSTFSEALRALWQELQCQDDQIEDLSHERPGLSEFCGSTLRVRVVGKPEDACVAVEVVDLAAGRIWECGFGQADGIGAVGFYRSVTGEDSALPPAWQLALAALGQAHDYRSKLQPSFMAMASAYLADSALAVVADRSEIELLSDDLAYWKQLAVSQARMLKRASATQVPQYVAPEPGHPPAEAEAPEPDWQLRDLDEWSAINAERIVVLPRAIAAAKRSEYASPKTAFSALELLAGTYRDVKLGRAPREALGNAVTELGLSIGGSVDPSRAGSAGSEYFVRWRGRRRFLDQHIGKGVSRDPRFTLRVYFTWDDEEKKAVVGWLPSHLSNSLT